MESPMKTKALGRGINFHSIIDRRFKSNFISVNLIVPLQKETATANALVPFLLKKGYADCPDFTEFNRKLSRLYGANLGADINKHGDKQILHLSISSIDNAYVLNNENVTEEIAGILANCIFRPVFENGTFKTSEVDLEKQNLVDLIESEINEKRLYAVNRMKEIMCADEPYGINQYGTIDQAHALTADMVTDAYKTVLSKAQMEIVYIGRDGDSIACGIFEKAIKDVKRGDIYNVDTTIVKEVGKIKEETEALPVNQSKLVMGFRTASLPEEDISVAMMVMSMLYGGTPTSKLFLNVRERLSLCYYCVSRFEKSKGILYVESGVDTQNIPKAKDEILRQLECMQNGEISEQEIEETKLAIINRLNTINDQLYSIFGWYLDQISYGTQKTPEMQVDLVKAVTKEQLIEAAKRVQLDTVYILSSQEEK